MKLVDSVKELLLKNSAGLFRDLWREDLGKIFTEVKHDLKELSKTGVEGLSSWRRGGYQFNVRESLADSAETLLVLKLLPNRLQKGFGHFKDDFRREFDALSDQKEKTIFVFKVVGALTAFTVGPLYGLRKDALGFSFPGIRLKNAFTRLLVAELVFRISRLFILRFLDQLLEQMSDEEEVKHLKYFQGILRDSKPGSEMEFEQNDSAVAIVDALKSFILTGVRNSR